MKCQLFSGRHWLYKDSPGDTVLLVELDQSNKGGLCLLYWTATKKLEQKKVKESLSGVRGVLNYAGWFSEAAGSVDRVNEWEAGLSDVLGHVHNSL